MTGECRLGRARVLRVVYYQLVYHVYLSFTISSLSSSCFFSLLSYSYLFHVIYCCLLIVVVGWLLFVLLFQVVFFVKNFKKKNKKRLDHHVTRGSSAF